MHIIFPIAINNFLKSKSRIKIVRQSKRSRFETHRNCRISYRQIALPDCFFNKQENTMSNISINNKIFSQKLSKI
jgi:hypothetical protein